MAALPTRQQVVTRIAQDVKELGDLLRSTVGSSGVAKTIVTNSDVEHAAVFTTSAASRLLSLSRLSKGPASQLVVEAAISHDKQHGDDALLLAALACLVFNDCHRQAISPIRLAAGMRAVRREAGAFFRSPKLCQSRKVAWSSLDDVAGLARAAFHANVACNLTEKQRHCLVTLALRTFLATTNTKSEPLIRYVTLLGDPLTSQVLDNTVLVPLTRATASDIAHMRRCHAAEGGDSGSTPFRVALFDVSIGVRTNPLPAADVQVTTTVGVESGEMWASAQQEMQLLRDLAAKLRRLRVHLLASQRIIHPVLVQLLRRHGIACVERLSIRHVGAIRCATGARVVSSPTYEVTDADVGSAANVNAAQLGRTTKPYLHVTAKAATAPIVTVVLRAHTADALEELSTVYKAAMRRLNGALAHPEVLPGWNATEIRLARHLRSCAATKACRPHAWAFEAAAASLLAIVRWPAGMDLPDGARSVGWDAVRHTQVPAPGGGDAAAASVCLEPLVAKAVAVDMALDTANTLLRIVGSTSA